MATLAELAAAETSLSEAETEHLARLVASWSLLSDLAYSDLLLVAPCAKADTLVVLGQVRPNNRATMIGRDLLGAVDPTSRWPLAAAALADGAAHQGTNAVDTQPVPAWGLPVGFGGRTIAAIVRLAGPVRGPASAFEAGYLALFSRFAAMVAEGTFPFREADVAGPGLPRVGDGIIEIDARGVVQFATPNAVNALHRLGLYDDPVARSLGDLGLSAKAVERALSYALPAIEEVDQGRDVAIQLHAVPLLDRGGVTGAILLLRDITDLKRLDRVVLYKDQAIKEVHHRIKNNLQTISSLLRLQARRSEDAHSATALLEAERRVRSIAVVHEVLAREPGEEVEFSEIVADLVAMVEDTVLVEHPVEITVHGDLGRLNTEIATPIAVVLAELLTNAVEHAFVDFADTRAGHVGVVVLRLANEDGVATAEIRDNGAGLPERFKLEATDSLGLSIVRDLVRTQLRGTIEMRSLAPTAGGGTYVAVRVPTAPRS